jgi:hypothetical protein
MHLKGVSVVVLRFFEWLRIAARSRAREVRIVPSRFVRRVRDIASESILARIFVVDIPAALTRMSTSFCRNISWLPFVSSR